MTICGCSDDRNNRCANVTYDCFGGWLPIPAVGYSSTIVHTQSPFYNVDLIPNISGCFISSVSNLPNMMIHDNQYYFDKLENTVSIYRTPTQLQSFGSFQLYPSASYVVYGDLYRHCPDMKGVCAGKQYNVNINGNILLYDVEYSGYLVGTFVNRSGYIENGHLALNGMRLYPLDIQEPVVYSSVLCSGLIYFDSFRRSSMTCCNTPVLLWDEPISLFPVYRPARLHFGFKTLTPGISGDVYLYAKQKLVNIPIDVTTPATFINNTLCFEPNSTFSQSGIYNQNTALELLLQNTGGFNPAVPHPHLQSRFTPFPLIPTQPQALYKVCTSSTISKINTVFTDSNVNVNCHNIYTDQPNQLVWSFNRKSDNYTTILPEVSGWIAPAEGPSATAGFGSNLPIFALSICPLVSVQLPPQTTGINSYNLDVYVYTSDKSWFNNQYYKDAVDIDTRIILSETEYLLFGLTTSGVCYYNSTISGTLGFSFTNTNLQQPTGSLSTNLIRQLGFSGGNFRYDINDDTWYSADNKSTFKTKVDLGNQQFISHLRAYNYNSGVIYNFYSTIPMSGRYNNKINDIDSQFTTHTTIFSSILDRNTAVLYDTYPAWKGILDIYDTIMLSGAIATLPTYSNEATNYNYQKLLEAYRTLPTRYNLYNFNNISLPRGQLGYSSADLGLSADYIINTSISGYDYNVSYLFRID